MIYLVTIVIIVLLFLVLLSITDDDHPVDNREFINLSFAERTSQMPLKISEGVTAVYGCSDDLIEIGGAVLGEYGCYGTDDRERGVLVVLSDSTVLEVKYGKNNEGIWEIKPLQIGSLFERIDYCDNEDASPYSDIAWFKPGIKWAYAASDWEKMQ